MLFGLSATHQIERKKSLKKKRKIQKNEIQIEYYFIARKFIIFDYVGEKILARSALRISSRHLFNRPRVCPTRPSALAYGRE